MNRLQGKIALVTGAQQGIGRATAEAFAAEGAIVYAADLTDGFEKIDGAHSIALDVSREEAWQSAVDAIVAEHGTIDVLVNNAGVIAYSGIEDIGIEEWNRVIGVDQTGVWLGMRSVIPSMLSAGAGSIINLSSAWGVVGGVGVAAYQAAKGAVRSMTRNAAITYAQQGVRVNSIVPGWIRTPLAEAQDPEINARVIGGTPMGRGAEPIEIAYGAVYLASDESSYVTGTDLVIDGGLLAR
ncbi:SDR family NAD(P)-dependent oxidoreductase [Rhodococcoides kyotonense]|uniref:NAD(P)-dependent dehydrogenase, short-chain alcohol dehydrogenase family n=1 Tax=Rhodococcoides kyotonense TaxID=398843 RepID=A0A239FHU7_9NOCA|nr:SDR family oxidoreductase [Rhodococcus kyotonensis]SNS56506.1 NAD(P)-dependent dehydrogenase, short-chain alcohol dehydrogenase family [Rhodococcus kyotonensis]